VLLAIVAGALISRAGNLFARGSPFRPRSRPRLFAFVRFFFGRKRKSDARQRVASIRGKSEREREREREREGGGDLIISRIHSGVRGASGGGRRETKKGEYNETQHERST